LTKAIRPDGDNQPAHLCRCQIHGGFGGKDISRDSMFCFDSIDRLSSGNHFRPFHGQGHDKSRALCRNTPCGDPSVMSFHNIGCHHLA